MNCWNSVHKLSVSAVFVYHNTQVPASVRRPEIKYPFGVTKNLCTIQMRAINYILQFHASINYSTILSNYRYKNWNISACYMQNRSQCPHGLRRGSTATRLLGLRVRIPPDVMDVCLLYVLCAERCKYLRRADHSYREVLSSAECLSSIVILLKCRSLGPLGGRG